MSHGSCDFWFAGTAILPTFLLVADEPALAVLAFCFLLGCGAVCGIAEPDAPGRFPTRR